jgi:hypothetical protein
VRLAAAVAWPMATTFVGLAHRAKALSASPLAGLVAQPLEEAREVRLSELGRKRGAPGRLEAGGE